VIEANLRREKSRVASAAAVDVVVRRGAQTDLAPAPALGSLSWRRGDVLIGDLPAAMHGAQTAPF
jgi:hypothetical protein